MLSTARFYVADLCLQPMQECWKLHKCGFADAREKVQDAARKMELANGRDESIGDDVTS